MEEVEQICTRIVIMDHGRSIASGTGGAKEDDPDSRDHSYRRNCFAGDQLQHIRELHVAETEYDQSQCLLTVKCTRAEHNLVRLLNYLQGQQVAFHQVYSQLPTLNDVFPEITGKELRD